MLPQTLARDQSVRTRARHAEIGKRHKAVISRHRHLLARLKGHVFAEGEERRRQKSRQAAKNRQLQNYAQKLTPIFLFRVLLIAEIHFPQPQFLAFFFAACAASFFCCSRTSASVMRVPQFDFQKVTQAIGICHKSTAS